MKAEYDMSKGKRGAIISHQGKTRITLYLDNRVIKHFREDSESKGKGYQTLINDALCEAIKDKGIHSQSTLRRIIREELKVINDR